ncbi:hypothetical protein [Amycolatopsis rifamycinica]|uniref:Uncharacterized protein n=1 Tax=Amycolatopsis rifamycinica TaxID=287986 RepID=A0A066TLN9_9PSEU|nr:hypothetical protein [Amycolatopsis rifamycinica]KDN16031.1 hypothetical protein DV20_43070 [Amycolatopsis rifamycinica]
MWKHRSAVLRGGAAGRLGRRGLPYLLLFQVVLPMLVPLVDLAALADDRSAALGYWLVFLLVQWCPGSSRSGSTASASGRCWRCRCSSSSTGS